MAQEPKPAGDTKDSSSANLVAAIIKKEKIDTEVEKKILALKEGKVLEPSDNKENSNEDGDSLSSEDDEEDSSGEEHSDEEEDEKKNIEPVKSSNEILEELFKVFNAKPPEELLDDKNLIEKTIKKKKDKKKKHKRSKSGDDHTESEGEIKDEDDSGAKRKHKKKKKHKHKHKDEEKSKSKKKSKDGDKVRVKEESSADKKKTKEKDKHGDDKIKDTSKHSHHSSEDKHRRDSLEKRTGSSDHKRHHEREHDDGSKRRRTDDKEIKINPFYGASRDKDKDKSDLIKIKTENVEKISSKRKEDGDISEISLSDEEDYLEEKRGNSKYKSHNSFYAGTKRSRSREGDRHYSANTKERFRDRERSDREGGYRRGGRNYSHRSRSRSRSRDLGIDKKRLLEIARKNAISMFKRGNLPGCANMTEDVKDKVLLKMRYGGRTVEDLTEFCKKISNGEHLSELSSDEGSDIDKSGNAKAFHHPFQIKEREPIVMHIRNSKTIVPAPVKTDEQTKTITMQFPVSSGQQHRMTEAWIPVEPKEKLPPLPVLPAATQSTTIFKSSVVKNALGKPLPKESEQEPAFKPVENPGTTIAGVSQNSENPAAISLPTNNIPAPAASQISSVPPPPVPPPYFYAQLVAQQPAAPIVPPPALPVPPPMMPHPPANNFTPDVPVPSSAHSISVFPEPPAQPMDVSAIISKRLNAMRRLQENPMDSEAIKMMYNSQKEMTTWAASKHLPGQFTGSTGVNVLKPNQLHSGPQHWARRDQLTSTKPVTGGMGMHLLQKMGWRPGEGLGREKNGSLQPLLLDVKLDKRGLVAQEDIRPPKSKRGGGGAGGVRNGGPVQQPIENLQNKHPVCLLNEITTKYKWTPPLYTVVQENGPSHSRMFLFSVQVNDRTFTPTKLCNTKKEAKYHAAKLCLQEMGILPPD
ncbi:protein Son [Musca domestica]|uniref:Protein SON n=1 Tax=Musca domestica TaxID=7370 RepID=A0A1I8NE88_MUSDO|nr:protein Son [Musca domestica]